MRYLFEITIGPVQEFIASARRTRDLWFGSWLLSELAREAARAITTTDPETTLIFPAPDVIRDQHFELANVANKILASVALDPHLLGPNMVSAVRGRLQQLMIDAFDRGRIDWKENSAGRAIAELQVDDLIELYWAAVPLVDGKYGSTRHQLEALIAARKATRDFGPALWAAAVPKSSLDGQRESVIPEDRYPTRTDPQRGIRISQLYQQYRAGPAERLSGVDLLKRHGQPHGQPFFPSTADIAARPLLRRLARHAAARSSWTAYIAELQRIGANLRDEQVQRHHSVIGRYDGGLLFESRLGELFDDLPRQRDAAQALATFLRTVGLPAPHPYYAILQADGDRMGATIDAQTEQAAHELLSQRLSQFAAQVREIVSLHDGALVYAGGDDILAFLPLDTMLECARELHDAFGTAINPPGSDQPFVDKQGFAPTLSVGMAICHQIEPLSDALKLAHAAELTAKDVNGKDALAIVLSKRSGADVTVAGKWSTLDRRLSDFTSLYQDDQLPDGAAFQLRDLTERLLAGVSVTLGQAAQEKAEQRVAALGPAALAEAKRILTRKQPQRGASRMDAQKLTDLVQQLDPTVVSIRAAADELIVARVLAEAVRIATGKE